MKKITLIHHNMVFGGVEKVLLNFLKNLDRQKFQIKLILFEKEGELLNELPEDIEIIFLNKKDKSIKKNILEKIIKTVKNISNYKQQLKKILNDKTEVLLILNIRYWIINLTLLNLRNKKIGWIHGNILNDYGNILEKLNYKLFAQYNLIFNVSKEGKKDFDNKFKKLKNKSKYLYNSLDITKILELNKENLDIKEDYILTVGRLSIYDKGYDILIEAISLLKKEGINKKLYIIGDGKEREKLEKQIKNLNLEKNIFIKGFDKNPYKWMKNAEMFVLSSRGEGLPTVLIEALACEAPIVSTNCKCGPREILDNGEYGVLVPVGDSEALKEGIKKVLLVQIKLKEKSLKRAKDFSNEKIIKQLENQILEL
ncbi:MAG: glycosyltransferase [Fusobacteriaceae bacterium]